jgi:hypothetical protein
MSVPAVAQQFYVRAAAGYAVPILQIPVIINGTPYNGQTSSSSTQAFSEKISIEKASLGAGIQGSLHAGCWFTKNFGADVGLEMSLLPRKYKGIRPYGLNTGNGRADLELTEYAKGLKLATIGLALRQKAAMDGFFVNAGFVLPVTTKVIIESESVPATGEPNTYTKSELHLRYGVGVYGTLGYNYKITKHLAVMGNISVTALSLWAKESHLRAYTVNGEDRSADILPEWREISYEKNYLAQTTNATDPDGRRILPSYLVPFSNLSFKLGLQYSF